MGSARGDSYRGPIPGCVASGLGLGRFLFQPAEVRYVHVGCVHTVPLLESGESVPPVAPPCPVSAGPGSWRSVAHC